MEQYEVSEKQWLKIRAYLFRLVGKNFLVVVDYTSNYPEVAKLEDLSSANTISHMKAIVARHGVPRVVVSDNGPQPRVPTVLQSYIVSNTQHLVLSIQYNTIQYNNTLFSHGGKFVCSFHKIRY